MREELHINDQVFHVVRVAAKQVPYSKDYITRLAREKKIKAVHIAREWYVDLEALVQYEEVQRLEADVRNRHLKLQRKVEHGVHDRIATNTQIYIGRSVAFLVTSVAAVVVILSAGFFTGTQLGQFMPATLYKSQQTVVKVNDVPVLIPRFVESEDEMVVVENGRVVDLPVAESDWLRVRYE
jgi:hypothetical protein